LVPILSVFVFVIFVFCFWYQLAGNVFTTVFPWAINVCLFSFLFFGVVLLLASVFVFVFGCYLYCWCLFVVVVLLFTLLLSYFLLFLFAGVYYFLCWYWAISPGFGWLYLFHYCRVVVYDACVSLPLS
jgi:hypothetical protein